jgi:hypothetical protein
VPAERIAPLPAILGGGKEGEEKNEKEEEEEEEVPRTTLARMRYLFSFSLPLLSTRDLGPATQDLHGPSANRARIK